MRRRYTPWTAVDRLVLDTYYLTWAVPVRCVVPRNRLEILDHLSVVKPRGECFNNGFTIGAEAVAADNRRPEYAVL